MKTNYLPEGRKSNRPGLMITELPRQAYRRHKKNLNGGIKSAIKLKSPGQSVAF